MGSIVQIDSRCLHGMNSDCKACSQHQHQLLGCRNNWLPLQHSSCAIAHLHHKTLCTLPMVPNHSTGHLHKVYRNSSACCMEPPRFSNSLHSAAQLHGVPAQCCGLESSAHHHKSMCMQTIQTNHPKHNPGSQQHVWHLGMPLFPSRNLHNHDRHQLRWSQFLFHALSGSCQECKGPTVPMLPLHNQLIVSNTQSCMSLSPSNQPDMDVRIHCCALQHVGFVLASLHKCMHSSHAILPFCNPQACMFRKEEGPRSFRTYAALQCNPNLTQPPSRSLVLRQLARATKMPASPSV